MCGIRSLGSDLRECIQLVNLVEGRSINQIFGYPDDLKFRSSMSLASVTPTTRYLRMLCKSTLGANSIVSPLERL